MEQSQEHCLQELDELVVAQHDEPTYEVSDLPTRIETDEEAELVLAVISGIQTKIETKKRELERAIREVEARYSDRIEDLQHTLSDLLVRYGPGIVEHAMSHSPEGKKTTPYVFGRVSWRTVPQQYKVADTDALNNYFAWATSDEGRQRLKSRGVDVESIVSIAYKPNMKNISKLLSASESGLKHIPGITQAPERTSVTLYVGQKEYKLDDILEGET